MSGTAPKPGPKLGASEPVDAEFDEAPVRARPAAAPRGPRQGVGLATALGLSTLAALAGGAIGAVAQRIPGVPRVVDRIAPNELAQARDDIARAQEDLTRIKGTVSEIERNRGLGAEARAELDAARTSLTAIEARLADWDRGLQLLPEGPAAFDPLRKRLAALESLPADPTTASPQQLARTTASLAARMDQLEQTAARSLTFQAGAARIDPVALAGRVQGLEREVAETRAQVRAAAPFTALQGLEGEVDALQARFSSVARDSAYAAGAARAALALSAATDASRGSAPFADAYRTLRAAMPNDPNVRALEALSRTGAPSLSELVEEFAVIELELTRAERTSVAGGGVWGQVQGALAEYVVVRRVENRQASEDAVARAAQRLAAGDLETAVRELSQLPGEAGRLAAPWLARARARLELDARLALIRAELTRQG